MKKTTIQRRLTMALSRMLTDEWRLLNVQVGRGWNAVSEQAVAFQFGWHLRPLIDRWWDIDCEYNRSGGGAEAMIKRAEGRPRRPDLIIHRRGESGSASNLLMMEIKTNDDEQTHKGGSIKSVRALMEEFQYQHGVLLDLGVTHTDGLTKVCPRWIWLDSSIPTDVIAVNKEPVYAHVADLEAIMARGRYEEQHRYRHE